MPNASLVPATAAVAELPLPLQPSSAMLSSPRSPSSTMRIFSSAEKCRRVARRMSLIASSAGCFSGPDFCLIFALAATMIQKSSLPEKLRLVSKVLTADNVAQGFAHRDVRCE
jgi:hypothetical protein